MQVVESRVQGNEASGWGGGLAVLGGGGSGHHSVDGPHANRWTAHTDKWTAFVNLSSVEFTGNVALRGGGGGVLVLGSHVSIQNVQVIQIYQEYSNLGDIGIWVQGYLAHKKHPPPTTLQ